MQIRDLDALSTNFLDPNTENKRQNPLKTKCCLLGLQERCCPETGERGWGVFKGFYENIDNKPKGFCTNKPCGIRWEPAETSEEVNLKDMESLNA